PFRASRRQRRRGAADGWSRAGGRRGDSPCDGNPRRRAAHHSRATSWRAGAVQLKLSFTLNGQAPGPQGAPLKRLLDVLREDFALTGTKEGCGEGECGACSVLLDGRVVNSCLVPACQATGSTVVTIEGLADENGGLSELQRAFVECGAAQCGICTPG